MKGLTDKQHIWRMQLNEKWYFKQIAKVKDLCGKVVFQTNIAIMFWLSGKSTKTTGNYKFFVGMALQSNLQLLTNPKYLLQSDKKKAIKKET